MIPLLCERFVDQLLASFAFPHPLTETSFETKALRRMEHGLICSLLKLMHLLDELVSDLPLLQELDLHIIKRQT